MATSDKILLKQFLQQIKRGHTQLPDFQRDWKWSDDNIRKLLASVSLSYPIGAVMVLQTSNSKVFQTRSIKGVEIDNLQDAEWLVLDGQQRLTALYQTLMSDQPVLTKGKGKKAIELWYYVNMKKSLESTYGSQRDEAIISIPTHKKYTFNNQSIELNDAESEYENCLFPLNKIFDVNLWRRGYEKYWIGKDDQSKIDLYDQFAKEILEKFITYEVPYILLPKETPMQAVCQVFVRVNRGGEQLTTFDLLTAKFAIDSFNLREEWQIIHKQIIKNNENHIFAKLSNMAFLYSIFLLVNIKKEKTATFDSSQMLEELTLEDYQKYSQEILKSLEEVERFLHKLKVFSPNEIPYTQLIPLAVTFAQLERDELRKAGIQNRIERWFWCGVIAQRYGRKAYQSILTDIKELPNWLLGKASSEPEAIINGNFVASKLQKLSSRNNSLYKGLCLLIMEEGCQDFLTKIEIDDQKYFDDKIDMHHIFPQAWCKKNCIDQSRYNSIINKTPISASTNRKIGGRSPSEYLEIIMEESHLSKDEMNKILRTHLIEPETLWNNDFDSFFKAREQMILQKIEKKTKNRIISIDELSDDNNEELEDDNHNEDLSDW